MDAEKANYTIMRMSRLLHVARGGYYAWRNRQAQDPGPRASKRALVDAAVRRVFMASDEVYGAPRVRAELAADGLPLNVKTMAASMRRQSLEGVSPRKWRPVTTIPGVATHAIPDRVERQWGRGGLNRVWIFDNGYGGYMKRVRASKGSKSWWVTALSSAEVERMVLHDLRHTAASLAVSSGANVKAVQRMLGHASAAMTLNVYADLFVDDLEALSDRLDLAIASRNVVNMLSDAQSENEKTPQDPHETGES